MIPSPTILEARARRAYEWARVRRAVWGVGPLVFVVAVAAFFSARWLTTCVVGAVSLVIGGVLLWRGGGLQRALVPGVAAGLVPLVFSLCANRYGHACFGGLCMQVCLAASALGGCGAGVVVSRWAARRHERSFVVGTAAALGLLVGSMGSSCVGINGVYALVLGFAATLTGGLLLTRRA